MSELFKLAYDVTSAALYNVVEWIGGFFQGLLKVFFTGWKDYATIFKSYFADLPGFSKVLAILFALIFIAVPVLIVVIIVRRIVLRIQLRALGGEDNTELYKEIGRLNRQVTELMDEKAKLLGMKVGGVADHMGVDGEEGDLSPADLTDPLAQPYAAKDVGGSGSGAVVSGMTESAIGAATAAAITAAQNLQNENKNNNLAERFPKLCFVDEKYADYQQPEFDNHITLEQFTENLRLFAASQLKLYYVPEILRRFVAGMAASRILILEGISGTGKTSLPYAFSRFVNNPATMVAVQPSFRDRTELVGYFNEFSKRFNETEFLRAVYEANYRKEPSLIVLDEMNLARVEYYFAEMLSLLELPNSNEWMLDLVPTAWANDPVLLDEGKVHVPNTMWYVGTANNDDSTFTITDKVYDRAIPIELNERAAAFECESTPKCHVTCQHLLEMFAQAKEEHPISDEILSKLAKLDQYLQAHFKLSFGNRIMKQMYDFIPVYVACGGTEIDGLDYIVARKVFKKFESLNVAFVRDEIRALIEYMEDAFGKTNMKDSRSFLERIQNMY